MLTIAIVIEYVGFVGAMSNLHTPEMLPWAIALFGGAGVAFWEGSRKENGI